MKVTIGSDLHNEHGIAALPKKPGDVLILAGDITQATYLCDRKHVKFFEECAERFNTVLYVPGNHEYWFSKFSDVDAELRSKLEHIHNLHLLNEESIDIDGKRFFGCTMWTDLKNEDPLFMMKMDQQFSDLQLIKGYSSAMWAAIHKKHKASYMDNVTEDSIAITHHAPSTLSIPDRFHGDSLNPAFASDLSDMILDCKPKLHIHGHTHDRFDYNIGTTRVICNPRGYPFELNRRFEYMTVEV